MATALCWPCGVFAGAASAASDAGQQISSAFAVETKQGALSASNVSDGTRVSKQQLASSMGALRTQNDTLKAFTDFSGELGQPNSIDCDTLANGALTTATQDQIKRDSVKVATQFVNTRTTAKNNRAQRLKQRSQYCSPDEAKQGMCVLQADKTSSMDTDYAKVSQQPTLSPEGELAMMDYAENVVSYRADSDKIACQTAACVSATFSNSRTMAINSMVSSVLLSQTANRRAPVLTGE
jgi:hypothetical protein